MSTEADAALVLGLCGTILTTWDVSGLITASEMRERYDKQRVGISCTPPGWLFGAMWTVLYVFLVVAGYFLFTAPTSPYFLIYVILFPIFIGITKTWNFFYYRVSVGAGIPIICIMLGILVALIVLTAKDANWWPLCVFAVNAGWSAYALILNLIIYCHGGQKDKELHLPMPAGTQAKDSQSPVKLRLGGGGRGGPVPKMVAPGIPKFH